MSDDIKISKGLEFPVVVLAGAGYMPDEQEATRAMQRLVVGVGGDGISQRIGPLPRSDYSQFGV